MSGRRTNRQTVTETTAGGELVYERQWVENGQGEMVHERVTNGRLDGQVVSDRELEILLGRR